MPVRHVLVILSVGLLAATVIELGWFQFLPSATVSQYGPWVGLVATVGIALAFVVNWAKWKRHIGAQPQRSRWLRNPWIMAFVAVTLGVVFIQAATLRLFPHLIVLAAGEPGARDFKVAHLTSSRRCRSGITLEEMPFLGDRICGLTEDFRSKIAPGMSVTVRGQMNWAGLIPESVVIRVKKN